MSLTSGSYATTRNDVADGLLAFSQAITWRDGKTFKRQGRKFADFSQWGASDYPVLIQLEPTEMIEQKTRMPSIRRMEFRWLIFIKTDPSDPDDIAAAYINDMLDAIEAAFAPADPFMTQDLNGLVEHAFINGTIIKGTGDDVGEGAVAIPITVLIP